MEIIVYPDREVLVSYTPFATPYTHAKCSSQHLCTLRPITDAPTDNSPYNVVYISVRPESSKYDYQKQSTSRVPTELKFTISFAYIAQVTPQIS